ncbi:hypothetical protein [Haloarcula laminariae]|uniref:hypothetical protein n=1 Tax=Haloarcula laminariae TaxID=2961577 RepID=UPI0024075693|nr:hypothetical protein [Halomicroarcula sp. FL173]
MTEQASQPPSRWWLPIAGIVAVMVAQAATTVLLPPDPVTTLPLLPLAAAGFVLTICSPVCVHLDRRYVTAVSDWVPSGWYYWMALPPLTLVLAPLYLLRRHQHVGVP